MIGVLLSSLGAAGVGAEGGETEEEGHLWESAGWVCLYEHRHEPGVFSAKGGKGGFGRECEGGLVSCQYKRQSKK